MNYGKKEKIYPMRKLQMPPKKINTTKIIEFIRSQSKYI